MRNPRWHRSGKPRRGKGAKRLKLVLVVIVGLLLSRQFAFATQEVTVAVAANFILPFEQLSTVFEQKNFIRVKATFSSTGNLYAQIKNGAPYDVFLAADEARPRLLCENGFAEEPFIYARGRVVLWSMGGALCKLGQWQKVVTSPSASRIAIANPETAPYGAVAAEALKKAGLWKAVKAKLVFAQTVAQAFQYAHTKCVDAGFCALCAAFSAYGKKGCHWVIPEASDVIQAACVLKRGVEKRGVQEFVTFLRSSEASAIKEKHGYE